MTKASGAEPHDSGADTSGSGRTMPARTLSPGDGAGRLLLLDAPVSFWGGVDSTGTVVDRHHPRHGVRLSGRVVVMPSGKGSSSSSSVLAEHIRAGVAPAAIVLREPDMIVTLGALAAGELYDTWVPVVVLASADFDGLPRDGAARVEGMERGARVTLGVALPLSVASGRAGEAAVGEQRPGPRPDPPDPDR
ncbi:aconitase X swivel domain-containing protein [Streptomyces sp. NPDC051217]|uniref:aconitase X swivel domain-containing protein n=1 Tax=Streptomyces sp. NPDC051217 TaxID=3365644 RepID=UPI003788701A